jgi:hypothetical protein
MANVKRILTNIGAVPAIVKHIAGTETQQVKFALRFISEQFKQAGSEYLRDDVYKALNEISYNNISEEMQSDIRLVFANSRMCNNNFVQWAIDAIVEKY